MCAAGPDVVGVERAQGVMRGTFLASQGRSHIQVSLVDAVLRMWREEGLRPDWAAWEDPAAVEGLTRLRMPRGHSAYRGIDISDQFSLWWELFLRMAKYVGDGDPAHLPTGTEEARFRETYVYPLDPEAAARAERFKEQDLRNFLAAFAWYAEHDPNARMGFAEVVRLRALPGFIDADRQWVGAATGRPGTMLAESSDSLMRTWFPSGLRDRAEGRRLSDLRRLYASMSDVLDELERADPTFTALPTYPLLVAEYNQRHPHAPLARLHR